jgi:hypothetical protein
MTPIILQRQDIDQDANGADEILRRRCRRCARSDRHGAIAVLEKEKPWMW